MRIVDSVSFYRDGVTRQFDLAVGNLTDLPNEVTYDFLVVSTFPGIYTPTPGTLLADLERVGVSVLEMSRNIAVDLRDSFGSWVSQEITQPNSGVRFHRILCFEPARRGAAPEVIGDIFRCLAPLVTTDFQDARITMPLIATGEQGWDKAAILEALGEAALNWMAAGMPIRQVTVVVLEDADADMLSPVMRNLAGRTLVEDKVSLPVAYDYDVFISYAHMNDRMVSSFVEELKQRNGRLRIFYDRLSLNPSAAWQSTIYDAIDHSRSSVVFYSPHYISSKVCLEEFNIALFRNRELDYQFVFPIYLESADLPTYFKLLQYFDCRDEQEHQLALAANEFLAFFTRDGDATTGGFGVGPAVSTADKQRNVLARLEHLEARTEQMTAEIRELRERLNQWQRNN